MVNCERVCLIFEQDDSSASCKMGCGVRRFRCFQGEADIARVVADSTPVANEPEADLAPMLPEARCGLENKFVEHVVLAVRRSTGCRRSHFGCGWSSQM